MIDLMFYCNISFVNKIELFTPCRKNNHSCAEKDINLGLDYNYVNSKRKKYRHKVIKNVQEKSSYY